MLRREQAPVAYAPAMVLKSPPVCQSETSMCLRAKGDLEGTKVANFPRYCAPQKVQTEIAAASEEWRLRKATCDLTTRAGGMLTQRWQMVGYG